MQSYRGGRNVNAGKKTNKQKKQNKTITTKSNQFILEWEWTFGQSLKKKPQSVFEMWHSQGWPGCTYERWMDGQPKNITPPALVM